MYRYKRNVSYIYSYRNGEKIGNVGYIRTEIRDNLLKLWLWIKDSEVLPSMKVNIYMFNEKGESFQVGDIDIKNGVGEVKYITRPKNVFNSNMEISTIVGIGIYKDDRLVYKSVWIENKGEFDKVQDRGVEKRVEPQPDTTLKEEVEKSPMEDRDKAEKNIHDIEDMETMDNIEEVRKLGAESYNHDSGKDSKEEYQGIPGKPIRIYTFYTSKKKQA